MIARIETYSMEKRVATKDAAPAIDVVAAVSFCPVPPPSDMVTTILGDKKASIWESKRSRSYHGTAAGNSELINRNLSPDQTPRT